MGARLLRRWRNAPGRNRGLIAARQAGVAALIRAVSPTVPVSQMKNIIMVSADDIPSMDGITVSGGRLNAFFAIAEPDDLRSRLIFELRAGAGGDEASLFVADLYRIYQGYIDGQWVDADSGDTFSLSVDSPAAVVEGNPVTFTVTLNEATDVDLTVDVTPANNIVFTAANQMTHPGTKRTQGVFPANPAVLQVATTLAVGFPIARGWLPSWV